MPLTSERSEGPEIYVEGFSPEGSGVAEAEVRSAVRAALIAGGRNDLTGCELSVTAVGDEEIAALNRRWFGKDRPTDVIAFGLGEAPIVGDVYVSIERARAQAALERIPLREETLRLVVHGVLHVVGHDHPDGPEREASAMFALQERVVRRLLEEGPDS